MQTRTQVRVIVLYSFAITLLHNSSSNNGYGMGHDFSSGVQSDRVGVSLDVSGSNVLPLAFFAQGSQ